MNIRFFYLRAKVHNCTDFFRVNVCAQVFAHGIHQRCNLTKISQRSRGSSFVFQCHHNQLLVFLSVKVRLLQPISWRHQTTCSREPHRFFAVHFVLAVSQLHIVTCWTSFATLLIIQFLRSTHPVHARIKNSSWITTLHVNGNSANRIDSITNHRSINMRHVLNIHTEYIADEFLRFVHPFGFRLRTISTIHTTKIFIDFTSVARITRHAKFYIQVTRNTKHICVLLCLTNTKNHH